jgi:signal transduction histidine kinase
VVNERQVQYTNLAPGHYTFRVIACNNDGVWNEAGAFLAFSIAPAYYQTTWFRVSCAAAFLLLLWAAYRFRVHQLKHQFAIGLEARVNERTRIARDLHDTLLQSFNALLLRLQTVSNVLPAQPDEAKRRIDRAIEQASDAITEGRDTVNELRASGSTIDLDQAISNFASELLSGSALEPIPEVHVRVEGTPTPLNPIVRDEAYRIVTEALRNAIRHANAGRIEIEIRYDERQLRLRIGDNGTGIDPAILDQDHKAGHWGLRGMRERANLVGGTLEVWSQVEIGTEIELSIPAASVYATPPSARWSVLSRFGRS